MAKKRSWLELTIVLALGFAVSIGLFAYSILLDHGLTYAYLIFNTALATVPLLVSWRLVKLLKTKRWSYWEPLIWTFIWIIFLPNSFYMISDYIHLQSMSNHTILFNAVMFSSFIFLAMFMGLISLYQIHSELKKRLRPKTAATLIAIILLGCCFAIYLGRDLRWNSWDVVVNPGGLLFDISNLILKPEIYPDMGRMMISFFVFLGSVYLMTFYAARTLWQKGVNDLAAHIHKRQQS